MLYFEPAAVNLRNIKSGEFHLSFFLEYLLRLLLELKEETFEDLLGYEERIFQLNWTF